MDRVKKTGIQSVEVGYCLLIALTRSCGPMKLSDLANTGEMTMPSAHRYLVSFIRMGIVERDDETGSYDLGPGALQLGVAKLARFDVVGLSRSILEELSAEIGEPVALALWTDKGPICVSCVDTAGPIKLILRMGAVLPLLGSAAGLVFAAFHKSSALNKLRDKELDEIAKARKISQPIASSQLNAELAEIRIRGYRR